MIESEVISVKNLHLKEKIKLSVLLLGTVLMFSACSSGTEEASTSTEAESVVTESSESEEVSAQDDSQNWVLTSEDVTILSTKDNNGGTLHYDYSYDESGKLISVIAKNRFERILTYDAKGNLLTDISTSIKSDGSKSVLENNYTYDKNNRMVSYEKILDGETKSTEKREYSRKTYDVITISERCVYNYDDLMVEEYALDGSGNETLIAKYTYDDKGNAIKYENPGGSYIESTNTYNEDGQLAKVERVTVYTNGSEPAFDEIFDYTYDDKGNLLTLINYHLVRASKAEEMVAYYGYEYDENNRVIYSKTTENDVLTENWYEYDEAGNQIYQKTKTDDRIIEHNSVYEKR